MAEIDAIQYGRLLASFEHLTAELKATRAQLVALEDRLMEVESRFRLGKGTVVGLLVGLGGAAVGWRELIAGVFGK